MDGENNVWSRKHPHKQHGMFHRLLQRLLKLRAEELTGNQSNQRRNRFSPNPEGRGNTLELTFYWDQKGYLQPL
jgi:hypothetical protein